MASSMLRSSPVHGLRSQSFSPLGSNRPSSLRLARRKTTTRCAAEPNPVPFKEAAEQLIHKAAKASEIIYERAGLTAEQLLAQSNATAAQLQIQAAKTSSELIVQCEKAAALLASNTSEAVELCKETLASVKDEAPEPVKELAEVAIVSHSEEAVKKGAKIHDFCLGIPFGGLLLAGGLLWFVLSGSINALRFGVIMGSALLYSSISSLKAWRAGKDSSHYIIIQGVLSTIVFIAEVFRYSTTGVLFPTAITAAFSAAMIGFYAYVIFAGGNPPPKKSSIA